MASNIVVYLYVEDAVSLNLSLYINPLDNQHLESIATKSI